MTAPELQTEEVQALAMTLMEEVSPKKEKKTKKEKDLESTETKSKVSILGDEIIKKYGKDTFVDANFIIDHPRRVIPLSPALDIQLNGGIPEGSWVISSGKPKSGKSSTALQFAKNVQEAQYGGKEVFYGDVEGRLKPMNLLGIGLDLTRFHVIKSTREKILSAQDYLDIFESIIKGHPECLLIIDSSSALCDSAEQIEDINAQRRSSGPKLMAAFCRKMANVVPVNNTIVWVIQHLMANTSGYGEKWVEDGGEKIKYQTDVKLRVKMFEQWKEGDINVGQKITWEIVTSALGAPHGKAESYLRYGAGLDFAEELIELGKQLDLIESKGAWYIIKFLEQEYKLQGQAKVNAFLKEDPTRLDILYKKVKEMLC